MTTSTTPTLSPERAAQLRGISIATLSTALFKRGLRNAVVQGALPLNRRAARMVGLATTLRYIPAREDLDHLGVFADRENAQRKVVETIPPGHVLMIDSRGDASAASAGAILITRMLRRGAAGAVTDGGFRDTPELRELDFPVYCRQPAAPTNLTKHHAMDIDVPIGCGGVPVYVTRQVDQGASTFGLYPPSDESRRAYEAWRAAQAKA